MQHPGFVIGIRILNVMRHVDGGDSELESMRVSLGLQCGWVRDKGGPRAG
jgi:hypothetical protein